MNPPVGNLPQAQNGFPDRQMGLPAQQQQPTSQSSHVPSESTRIQQTAYVEITEQPASKALRFRYECEGRSAGSIPGVSSTPEHKTFPTIKIVGYKGRAVVVVSCVTKDAENGKYRPHPHNLVGKEGCKKGVCTLEVNTDTMQVIFSNLGIQCVKKKDIESALKAREEIRVDPFITGYNHKLQPSSIDLNAVRLCFQVFVKSSSGKLNLPLKPVVSDPIFDKKAMSDLVISALCSCSSTVDGGKDIILLCEKVVKEDIEIRFFEEKTGWEAKGEFQHTDVHKQTAIKFRTPRYRTLDIDEPVHVSIQLRRPTDGVTSEPLQFDYLPLDTDPDKLKRKRQKINDTVQEHIYRYQNEPHDGMQHGNMIKIEPADQIPPLYNMGYRIQQVNSPSPQPLSPNVYQNPSNTSSPYGYDRISPDIGNIYNGTPPPQSAQNQQFLGTPAMSMVYNFSNNLNPPFQSMPGSSNQTIDWGNDQYLMQFNNLNPANTHQQQQQHLHLQQQQQTQHQTQSQTQNITDSNLNIVGDGDAPTASGLMDIDSGLLHINSTEIMSNLSLT
ncbi:dl.2 family protein [Megaselia abdita]